MKSGKTPKNDEKPLLTQPAVLILEPLFQKIQKILFVDFSLGAGNKVEDIERTSDWSGVAIEHARIDISYVRTLKGYQPQFLKLKRNFNLSDEVFRYAVSGSNGLLARVGNCEEQVGLAAYYIIKNLPNEPSLKIDFVEMPDCFDHIFLKVTLEKEVQFFDPWMKCYFSPPGDEKIKETAKVLIQGLQYESKRTTNQNEAKQIDRMVALCNKEMNQPNMKLFYSESLSEKKLEEYCKMFEDTYQKGLEELYPHKFKK